MQQPLDKPPSTRASSMAFVVLASFFWGTSFPAISWGISQGFDPVLFTLARFVGSFVVVVLYAAARGLLGDIWRALRVKWVWIMAVFNSAAFVLLYLGQGRTSSTHAAIISSAAPPMGAVLAYFFLREPLGGKKLAALGAAFVGAVIVSLEGQLDALSTGDLTGDGLVFLAAGCWGTLLVINRIVVGRGLVPPHVLSLVNFVTTTPLVALLAIPLAGEGVPTDPWSWVNVAYLAIGCNVVPLFFFFKALERLPVVLVSVLMLSQALFGVVASTVALGEHLGLMSLGGGLLILAGGYLVARATAD